MRIYASKGDLADMLGISKGTVQNRLEEIKSEKRYTMKDRAVIEDGNIVRINLLVFLDYMTNRRWLMDKNLRKRVPPYNPEEVALSIGGANMGRLI